jgi:hypothetical protein
MTVAHRRAMLMVYERFHAASTWPLVGAIDHEEFVRTGKALDLAAMMTGLPNELGNHEGPRDAKVWLRLRGIRAAIGADAEELQDVVRVIARCFEMYRQDRHATLRRADLIGDGLGAERAARFHQLVRFESYPFGNGSGDENAEWELEIRSSVAHFDGASSIDEVFARQKRVGELERATFHHQRHPPMQRVITLYPQPTTSADPDSLAASIDPELWQQVAHLVAAEHWAQVATTTAIFFEARLRSWLVRPPGDALSTLVALALKVDGGRFGLGSSKGERQGWFNLALGLVALRNVDAHGAQPRSDPRRYAVGLVGGVSLLLTQMKQSYPELAPGRQPRRRKVGTA